MFIKLLVCLGFVWLFTRRRGSLLGLIKNQCYISPVQSDYTGPPPKVYNVCLFLTNLNMDNIRPTISSLIKLSADGYDSEVTFAAEYNSNANIIYLPKRKLILINAEISNEVILSFKNNLKCTMIPNNEKDAISLNMLPSSAKLTFYNQDYEQQELEISGLELCSIKMVFDYLGFKKRDDR